MDFDEAFREAMESLGYGEAAERRLTPAAVSAEARRIAAAEGIRYKSARRRLERRRTSGAQSRGQPNRRFAALVRLRGLRVHAVLVLVVSPKSKEDRERERTIEVYLPGSLLQEAGMVDALNRADLQAAEGAFWSAMIRTYEEVDLDEPSFLENAVVAGVSALDISWGSGAEGGVYEDLPF